MKYMPKDRENIKRLVADFGSENEGEITRLYDAQMKLLEENGVLSNITYRCVREICERQYSKPSIATLPAQNTKNRLFYELLSILCPDYLARLKPHSIGSMCASIKREEIQSAFDAANTFMSANPTKRVINPKGTRPVYSKGVTGQVVAEQFKTQIAAYIKENTGIDLPVKSYSGPAAIFYEEIAKNLGL